MIIKRAQYIILPIVLLITACTGTRHLSDEEFLVRDGKLVVDSDAKKRDLTNVKIELNKHTNIKENNKLFWMRPRLSLYNMVKVQEKEEGFKHWLKNKAGRAPQLYSHSTIERIRRSMEAELFNYGFFNAKVSVELKQRKNEVTPTFLATTGMPHPVGKVVFSGTGTSIDTIIDKELLTEEIVSGKPYQLKDLIETRRYIANHLMNMGYFYFKPDHLEFIADTNTTPGVIDLELRLKPDNPVEVYKPYTLNNIYIEDNFRLNETLKTDTLVINNLHYISPIDYINPKVVVNTVHLQKNGLYTRDGHIRTLNHIRSLNVYQFVNVQYNKTDSIQGKLNSTLHLVPMRKMSVSGELNANFKSNNYAGPGLQLSFLNRNTFRNAELLNLSFGGRFEAQIGQPTKTNFAYEFRFDGSLKLPRLYPFKSRVVKRSYLPTTTLNLGLGLQERVEYFQMITGNVGIGYNWRTSERLQHRLSPYEITLSSLLRRTSAFEEYLEANPTVRRSFEEQFILGPSYEIFIKSDIEKRSPMFIGLSIDFSGNIISALNLAAGKPRPTPEAQYTIFGLPYSQFIRSRVDFRYNIKVSKQHNIASRIIVGAGIPYGNSQIIPYIKQYFVGGPNSLRGFAARTIGPGRFSPVRSENQEYLVDQAGDIKVEANLEYRFPVYGSLKGAVFADAGNIWLVNTDSTRPGGKFVLNRMLDEMAISTGVGLRIDISPILFRFDFGWPIRYPYYVNGSKWVIRDIDFSKEWRKENIILNISLGYPF